MGLRVWIYRTMEKSMENEMTTTQGSKSSLEFGCGFNRGFKDVGRGASRQAQGLRGDGTRAGSKGHL